MNSEGLLICRNKLHSYILIMKYPNAKGGSQETPGVTGKFGLGIWNEAGQRLIGFCQENTLVIANTEIRLIIIFAAKDREALCCCCC